jgi:hypothetical protein
MGPGPSVRQRGRGAGGRVQLDLLGIKPYGLRRDGSQSRQQQQGRRRMFLLQPLNNGTRDIYTFIDTH